MSSSIKILGKAAKVQNLKKHLMYNQILRTFFHIEVTKILKKGQFQGRFKQI